MAAQRDLKESSIMALIETWLSERDRGAHLFSHSVGAAFRADYKDEGRACFFCANKKYCSSGDVRERKTELPPAPFLYFNLPH